MSPRHGLGEEIAAHLARRGGRHLGSEKEPDVRTVAGSRALNGAGSSLISAGFHKGSKKRQNLCILTPRVSNFDSGPMLAKKTSKNQITLPKAIACRFPGVDYFDVREEAGRIVLVPLRESKADEVRARLRQLGTTEDDVEDAVRWARQ